VLVDFKVKVDMDPLYRRPQSKFATAYEPCGHFNFPGFSVAHILYEPTMNVELYINKQCLSARADFKVSERKSQYNLIVWETAEQICNSI
jgi:hypothetical protein